MAYVYFINKVTFVSLWEHNEYCANNLNKLWNWSKDHNKRRSHEDIKHQNVC